MSKYELSISVDYVPNWGIVEAIRELFQNALDEETNDADNKMFFCYDADSETLKIGNLNSTLDIQSLLVGNTTKQDDKYIGQHGEGYKIATVVLLRTGHSVTFYNYNAREIWRPRLVKSRRYNGALVPTFFVEKVPVWNSVPEHSLVIEVTNITAEEYLKIVASNRHLHVDSEDQGAIVTKIGSILLDAAQGGRVYVSGLFVCTNSNIKYGYDLKPETIKLDRDRKLIDTFNLQWQASKIIILTNNTELIKEAARIDDGKYIGQLLNYCAAPSAIDTIALEFLDKHPNAIPVSSSLEFNQAKAEGLNPYMVTESERYIIKASSHYRDPSPVSMTLLERIEEWYHTYFEDVDIEHWEKFQSMLEELRLLL